MALHGYVLLKASLLGARDILKNIIIRFTSHTETCAAVVALQNRKVVVHDCQGMVCGTQKTVVESWMITVVNDRGKQTRKELAFGQRSTAKEKNAPL